MESLEEKVARLERQNKLLAMALIGPLFLAVVALFRAPDPATIPDEIRAKSFIVVNDEGEKLAELRPDEHGSGSLGLLNNDGEYIVLANSTPSKCGALHLAGADGRRRYMTTVSQDDMVRTAYYGSAGTTLLRLGQDLRGQGFMHTLNSKGTIVTYISSAPSGGYGLMKLYTDEGKSRVRILAGPKAGAGGMSIYRKTSDEMPSLVLLAGENKAPTISFLDQNGFSRLMARLCDDGDPSVALNSDDGRCLLQLITAMGQAGGIVCYDEEGDRKATWPISFGLHWGRK